MNLPDQNKWIISTVGALCKILFASRYASFNLEKSPECMQLMKYIQDPPSRRNRPLITFSNHISTIDDPIMWSFLPLTTLFCHPQKVRWTLGADEILFGSRRTFLEPSSIHAIFWRLSSSFFHAGKVLPIVRGNGLQQDGIILAKQVLNNGDWLHIFVEGKVNPLSSDILLPLRWGIAHLILDYYEIHGISPIVVPLIIQGTDELVPLEAIWKYPRFGKRVSLAAGRDIDLSTEFLDSLVQSSKSSRQAFLKQSHAPTETSISNRHSRKLLSDYLFSHLESLHTSIVAFKGLI